MVRNFGSLCRWKGLLNVTLQMCFDKWMAINKLTTFLHFDWQVMLPCSNISHNSLVIAHHINYLSDTEDWVYGRGLMWSFLLAGTWRKSCSVSLGNWRETQLFSATLYYTRELIYNAGPSLLVWLKSKAFHACHTSTGAWVPSAGSSAGSHPSLFHPFNPRTSQDGGAAIRDVPLLLPEAGFRLSGDSMMSLQLVAVLHSHRHKLPFSSWAFRHSPILKTILLHCYNA